MVETISHDTIDAIDAIQSHSQDRITLPFCAAWVRMTPNQSPCPWSEGGSTGAIEPPSNPLKGSNPLRCFF